MTRRKAQREKVYVRSHEAHPARWEGVEYEVITYDPQGSRAVDKAGRAARGDAEPVASPRGEE